ncbi:putative mitochondrial hypothetical protein [Leptomonas pyrrhocoris]|uniref:Uncharacterized protein n=1 Tax=Leptomonas pyrrhocoris TaxID=157538 RepID=A0A0M9FV52_LEPPY|nr:putative mitochondrial hypothetical protein [Leptomonas pyrrhocoris]KPA76587.1 putative mitochondrial hypothetical protein [Leptomonas pyrrhocoris]|eukprot:XP_015655026.1 putative mitochondrial hypothetical protein [Leptomonas pyrrhocoris]
MWVLSRPRCAAVCATALLCQKKQTAAGYMASAGKVGSEEKWAHAAMEYIHEKNHVNDARKRQQDVDQERSIASAYDRYSAVAEAKFDARMAALVSRMSTALEEMQKLGLDNCVEEAVLLNSEQPPGSYRRPSLTPPLLGYEPGFGLDVPQLRSQQAEYPPVRRPTDTLEFGAQEAAEFPFVDAHQIEDLATKLEAQVEEQHGTLREAAPITGVEGEAWEAYVALQRKALARQQLIMDLHNDPELRKKYDADEEFRVAEWERRGMGVLEVEAPLARDVELHYAQAPAYVAFRSH